MSRKGQEGVPDGYKRCSKCGEVKSVGDFGKESRKKDGLHSQCIQCRSEYRIQNTQRIKDYNKEYRNKNLSYFQEYKKTHADKERAHCKKYREKHPEYFSSYRDANKEHIQEYSKDYRSINKTKRTEYNARWRSENYDRYCARRCFMRMGIYYKNTPPELFSLMILQKKLFHAIKAQRESHKEVTNGKT